MDQPTVPVSDINQVIDELKTTEDEKPPQASEFGHGWVDGRNSAAAMLKGLVAEHDPNTEYDPDD